jgi:hypothetical protein
MVGPASSPLGEAGKSFPTIGNIFSNHWKTCGNFFQSLEKSPDFSNHWKTFFQSLENFFPPVGKRFRRRSGYFWLATRAGTGHGKSFA